MRDNLNMKSLSLYHVAQWLQRPSFVDVKTLSRFLHLLESSFVVSYFTLRFDAHLFRSVLQSYQILKPQHHTI